MRNLVAASALFATVTSGCEGGRLRRGVYPTGNDPTVDSRTLSTEPSCGEQDFALAKAPPNVMLVIDRSGSMLEPAATGSTTSKYEDLKHAVGTLVSRYDNTMRFGATFFAADDDCQPGIVGGIEAQNGANIEAQMAANPPGGNTPTAATLDRVIASKTLADPGRANYLVLATDGIPNCGDVDVRRRVEALYEGSPQVRTFIVGIGSETNSQPQLLNAWADAGGTARSGPVHYYQTYSPAELDAALDAIAGDIATCDFTLTSPPDDPHDMHVSEDGVPLWQSATSGWTFDPATNTLTLHGGPCDAIKNDSRAKLSVVYDCPSPPIF